MNLSRTDPALLLPDQAAIRAAEARLATVRSADTDSGSTQMPGWKVSRQRGNVAGFVAGF